MRFFCMIDTILIQCLNISSLCVFVEKVKKSCLCLMHNNFILLRHSSLIVSIGVKPVIQPIRAKNTKVVPFKEKVPFTLLYCDKY
jgi:hypothetical protein